MDSQVEQKARPEPCFVAMDTILLEVETAMHPPLQGRVAVNQVHMDTPGVVVKALFGLKSERVGDQFV